MKRFQVPRILAATGLLLALITMGSAQSVTYAAGLPIANGGPSPSIGFTLSPASASAQPTSGTRYTYTLTLSNPGSAALQIALNGATTHNWPVTFPAGGIFLPSYGKVSFPVSVDVPLIILTSAETVSVKAGANDIFVYSTLTMHFNSGLPNP